MNLSKLQHIINSLVPLDYAFEDDFVGITLGSEDSEVNGLAVTHELENEVLDYSINNNVNTLITYHPPSMKKKIEADGSESFEEDTMTSKFREAGINVITLHTAQDVCIGGNADVLVDLFEMTNTDVFAHTTGEFGAGRLGDIQKISSAELLETIESKLNTRIVRTNKYFQTLKMINSIAILPGSGTQFLDEVLTKADVFITGDVSHRYLLKGDEMNLGLVQVNHLSTEIPGMKRFVHNLSIKLGTKLEYFYNKYYE